MFILPSTILPSTNGFQVLLTCLWGWPVESAKQNSLPPTSWDCTKIKRATSPRRPTLLATTIESRTCFFMIFIGCPLKKQEGWHDGIFGSCNKMLPWKISIGVRPFQKVGCHALQISINIICWHKSFMFSCHKPKKCSHNSHQTFFHSSTTLPKLDGHQNFWQMGWYYLKKKVNTLCKW